MFFQALKISSGQFWRTARFAGFAGVVLAVVTMTVLAQTNAKSKNGGSKTNADRESQPPEARSTKTSTNKSDASEKEVRRKTAARQSDAKKPDAKKPDAKKPDAKKPDAKKPDAKQSNPKKSTPKKSDDRRADSKSTALTPGREAAALTFVELHHPELAGLLRRLKKGDQRQYARALRDIFQTSERLARLKEKSPDRYDLALDTWKLDSRIRLLAARMTMSDDPARDTDFESELKSLLSRRMQLRLKGLAADRARAEKRLAQLNDSIKAIESNPEAAAMKELNRVKRSLGLARPRPRKTQPVKAPAGGQESRDKSRGARVEGPVTSDK